METITTFLLSNWELICLIATSIFAITPTKEDTTVLSRIKNILLLLTRRS